MKIYTVGNGFIKAHLNYAHISERLDFSEKQIETIINSYKPDVLINCIGFTGNPNIDECEIRKETTSLTNTSLPILLSEVCKKKNIHLIHIGSGCIFFGKSPNTDMEGICHDERRVIDLGWKESDFANPKSYYSKTKYASDLVLGDMQHVSVLRIRMPISKKNNSRNLINKLRGYNKIIDIPNSVTFMDDLVNRIDWVAKNSHTGIFHVTNPEPITAAQIMMEYKKYVPDHNFEIINEDQLDKLTQAKRSNCILNTDKLNKLGFFMTNSEKALQETMKEYIKNI